MRPEQNPAGIPMSLPPSTPARPPLREAHAHIASHGRSLSMLSLAACASVGECLDLLGREAAGLEPGAWLLAHGARPEGWAEARWPDLAELDRAIPDRPGAVMSFDHHALACNSRAFVAAGVRALSADPPGGVICRDARTGAPTGLLLESAARLVWQAAPEPGPSQRREHVAAALADLAAHGFVEVHDMLAQPWLGPLLAELFDRGGLALRVDLYVPLEDFDRALLSAEAWRRSGLRLAGAKVFTDGTLNSRTAWTLEPFRDPMPGMERGKPLMTVGEIAAAIRRCRDAGLRLAAHAIGDGAVRACLDAAAMEGDGRAREDVLRIEHAEIVDAADVPRFAELGVTASVQPCHLLYDVEALRRYLPHRLERVLPLRDMIDAGLEPGASLLFGSDVPIVRPHPEDSIAAAVNRRREQNSPHDAIAPGQAVSNAQAWTAFTCPGPGIDP